MALKLFPGRATAHHGPSVNLPLSSSHTYIQHPSQSQRCRRPRVHISSQTVSGLSATGTGNDVIGRLGHVVVVRKQYSLFVGDVLQRLSGDAMTYAVQQVDDHTFTRANYTST